MNEISLNDYNPDIEELVDVLFIGPQGEVLRKLEEFNNLYNNLSGDRYDRNPVKIKPLAITKKWTWKPGCYDSMKQMYTSYCMRWGKKPRGASSIFDRRQGSYHTELRDKVQDIENIMLRKRREGATWLDDTTQISEEFRIFISSIQQAVDGLQNYISPGGDLIDVQIEQPDAAEHWTTADILKATNIVYYIDLQPIEMNVMRGDERMQVIPGMPINLRCRVNLIKWFNAYSSGNGFTNCIAGSGFSTYSRNDVATITGGISDNNGYDYNSKLLHPFISRGYGQGHEEYNNVCMGDNTRDINRSFFSNDMISFFHNLHTWLSVFTPGRTGPINPIHNMHIGIPEDWDDHYADIVGYDTNICDHKLREKYKPANVTTVPSYARGGYCDEIKCKLRSSCRTYSRINLWTDIIGEGIDKLEPHQEPWDIEDARVTMESLLDKLYQGRYPTDPWDNIDKDDMIWLIAHGHYGVISRMLGIQSNWMEVEHLDKFVIEGVNETVADDLMKREMEMWANAYAADRNIHGGEFRQTHTALRDAIDADGAQWDPEVVIEQIREINRENGEGEDE